MNDADSPNPHGRTVSPETQRLRSAARSLVVHFASVPINVDFDGSSEDFLTSMAMMFARQRYGCAESLVGIGFGGTVMGSLARSLFEDGLRWRWIAQDPEHRRTALLGDLLEERSRIAQVLADTDSTCPILTRWLMPLPDVADLTCASMTWLDAPVTPNEKQLLDDLLARPTAESAAATDVEPTPQIGAALLDIAGVRGIAEVLAFAGHGNYLGLQSSLTADGPIGFDARADYEALFIHAAAVGSVVTFLGASAIDSRAWPDGVDQMAFLDTATSLAQEVAEAAIAIHGLVAPRPVRVEPARATGHSQARSILRPEAVVRTDELLPEQPSPDRLRMTMDHADAFWNLVLSMPVDPWALNDPTLHEVIAYGSAHSNLETVMRTYDRPGNAVVPAFAARMLLEESARLQWRFADHDEDVFKARAKQFFDEFRVRRRKTIGTLNNGGVPRAVAERLFTEPVNVVMGVSHDDIRKGRVQIPHVSTLLRQMGAPYPEPGWLDVAYSLLSQVVHATSLGSLHTIRFYDDGWHGDDLSPEMTALALDVACLGAAVIIGHSTVVLTEMDEAAKRHYRDLRRAAHEVHVAARLVHGLD